MAQTGTVLSFSEAFAKSGISIDTNKQGAEWIDPYSVGAGLAMAEIEGWRVGKAIDGWSEMTHATLPRHAVHTNGRVHVWSNGWKASAETRTLRVEPKLEKNVYHDPSQKYVVYASNPRYYKGTLDRAKASQMTMFGETLYVWQYRHALPLEVVEALHAPRPGVWQAAVEVLGGARFWFECNNITAISEMQAGYYARLRMDVPDEVLPVIAERVPELPKKIRKPRAVRMAPMTPAEGQPTVAPIDVYAHMRALMGDEMFPAVDKAIGAAIVFMGEPRTEAELLDVLNKAIDLTSWL